MATALAVNNASANAVLLNLAIASFLSGANFSIASLKSTTKGTLNTSLAISDILRLASSIMSLASLFLNPNSRTKSDKALVVELVMDSASNCFRYLAVSLFTLPSSSNF